MSIIEKVKNEIKAQFEGESTGHDWHHILRVYNVAKYIQTKEGGDLETIELAALLHDISDHKFNGGKLDEGGKVTEEILKRHCASEELIKNVRYIVDNISFKGAKVQSEMDSLEGKIVQDADRLDAIGAIGIARTFAYGGNRNQPIYEPNGVITMHDSFEAYATTKTSSINHFYEKLLLLKDLLNTKTGIELGEKRHNIMADFLTEFHHEWNFNQEENK
ncbi:MAG: HD domain-containing protein [Crocinitomicaceae bacterium]